MAQRCPETNPQSNTVLQDNAAKVLGTGTLEPSM